MSNKKVSALRMEGCYDVKIAGGQFIVEHDGSADANAIDIVGSSKVEIGHVIAKVITHQQIKLLQDIELLVTQYRNKEELTNQRIDEVLNTINEIRNANQSSISTKVSDLIVKLVPLSELGVNVLDLIQKITQVFNNLGFK